MFLQRHQRGRLSGQALLRNQSRSGRLVCACLLEQRGSRRAKGEFVCIDITKVIGLLGLDEHLEIINGAALTENAFDVGSPSTRKNRFRRVSVIVLRSIK